ncbi:unnamed protein product [marine sediment metagenome]|uniref:Uncharacterized protein n=1 Tax=marine sediment metagenome TaxID=412755 RepID=X1KK44_9ZZZZ
MKPRFLGFRPGAITFMPSTPMGPPIAAGEPIYMAYDEYEALRPAKAQTDLGPSLHHGLGLYPSRNFVPTFVTTSICAIAHNYI